MSKYAMYRLIVFSEYWIAEFSFDLYILLAWKFSTVLLSKLVVVSYIGSTKFQDLDNLQNIWEMNLDWETNWNDWKVNSFKVLNTESMEDHVNQLFKKLVKIGRELKVSYCYLLFDDNVLS